MSIPLHRVDPKTGAWTEILPGEPIPAQHIRIEERDGEIVTVFVGYADDGGDIVKPHVHGVDGTPVTKEHLEQDAA